MVNIRSHFVRVCLHLIQLTVFRGSFFMILLQIQWEIFFLPTSRLRQAKFCLFLGTVYLLAQLLHLTLKFHLISIWWGYREYIVVLKQVIEVGLRSPLRRKQSSVFNRVNIFSGNAQRQVKLYFFSWGGGEELFSIPCYNGTEKRVVFSTIYKVYDLQQSCPLSYYKEWEKLAAKRTNHSLRDTEIPKGERHPRTPNLITTVKPETSKLKDLTLKGAELNERNCKTTAKIRAPPPG